MKVYNLACEEHAHRFEGWFRSEHDFEEQLAQQLISCPLCASLQIKKLLSAPHLNLGSVEKPDPQLDQRAQLRALAQKIVANTEDVGRQFAQEARRIHYHEAPLRGIRGVVSVEEKEELQDEGIEIMALPVLDGGKETMQ